MVLQEILARCFLSAKDYGCALKLGIICVKIFILKSWAILNPGRLSFTLCRPWLQGICTQSTRPFHSPTKLDLID